MSVNLGNYAYKSDFGVRSIEGLKTLAASSGVPFAVGSDYRPSDLNSWHGYQNAIDIFSSVNDMQRLAAYLIQYAHYLGELFFTPPTAQKLPNGRWTGGFYVDNGSVLQSISESVAVEHRNHVHLAATNSGLAAAAKQTPELLRAWQVQQKKLGGALPPAISVPGTSSNAAQHSTVDSTFGVTSGQKRPGCVIPATAILTGVPIVATILNHYL